MSDNGRRPLVSVVVPCYNQAHFLAEAVRSASARTVRIEIIVVDDGSTDHTAAVARGLRDVLLVRQHNRGLSSARNRGMRAASGEFLIFLDADDRLLPGAVDVGARALAAHPECAMAYGRSVMMSSDGQLWPAADVPVVRSGHHAALLQTNFIWMPAAAIFRRAAVAAAGGFAEGIDGAADYDLYLRLSRGSCVHDHGEVVAAHRRHDGAMSRQPARMLCDTLAVMQRNRPDAGSNLHRAWREGYMRWQDLYGTQLADEIRRHAHARAFGEAWRKGLLLARLAPGVLMRELHRAARVPSGRRSIAAPDVPTPGRGAET